MRSSRGFLDAREKKQRWRLIPHGAACSRRRRAAALRAVLPVCESEICVRDMRRGKEVGPGHYVRCAVSRDRMLSVRFDLRKTLCGVKGGSFPRVVRPCARSTMSKLRYRRCAEDEWAEVGGADSRRCGKSTTGRGILRRIEHRSGEGLVQGVPMSGR